MRLRRLAGAGVIALLALIVAVTPLSATFQPGYFDVRHVDAQGSVLLATLEDHTGLVSAFGFDPTGLRSSVGTTRTLIVSWIGGCEDPSIYMRFYAVGDRYALYERTNGSMCFLDVGN